MPRMIKRVAKLGIGKNFHFTGFLKGAEVERIFTMSDLYVMPSVSEPFGISPLEAMLYDVPVIISKQSGVSEILHHVASGRPNVVIHLLDGTRPGDQICHRVDADAGHVEH